MPALHVFTALCFLLLAAVQSTGIPIKPDIKKLAEEAQRPRPMFIPSRVGWNGPEIQAGRASITRFEASMAPVLKAERERRLRNTLRELVIPEPRALLGVAGIIFLLRKLRRLREQQAMLARRPQPA
jgi:hypothetical protein